MEIETILQQLTLEEKAELCSGSDFWHSQDVERLGIPALLMTDGPSGLRKQDGQADHLGLNASIPAVCFPSAAAVASSFDTDLAQEVGQTLGSECRAEQVALLLGPGLNIKRSPLCGRNFEYFSEDPYLSGEMGKALVRGIQSSGTGSCIKHFAANNQETDRMTSDSVLDERTLFELYLPAFEAVVKDAHPRAVMCAYNKINGVHCSENQELLTDILRTRWGYDGMVVTDWGAAKDRAVGLAAGLDLEMPGGASRGTRRILEAVGDGTLSMEELDTAVRRILRFVQAAQDAPAAAQGFDRAADYRKAVQAAEGCAVLLKNEGGLLPLRPGQKVAFIGEFAQKPRYQGGGSSHVNSARVTSALDFANGGVVYAQGYEAASDRANEAMQAQAVAAAKAADAAVIFAGLPERYESEGVDRDTLDMPQNQNELIAAVTAVQPNTAVVLYNGAPVTMPWLDQAAAVLEMYLPGDGAGEATMDLLYGRANPSGKLAETFPKKLSDTPCALTFPGERQTSVYAEGIFVGYRYYDAKQMPVLFPFGHGLSYTSFAYSDLKLGAAGLQEGGSLDVQLTVTNTGQVPGQEVVQLYIAPPKGERRRPPRELRRFAKVSLAPGESKTVRFTLETRDFAYYEPLFHDFFAPTGTYVIQIGASSRDIRVTANAELQTRRCLPHHFTEADTLNLLMTDPRGEALLRPLVERMTAAAGAVSGGSDSGATTAQMVGGMQLRTLLDFGALTTEQAEAILQTLNAE